MKKKYGYLILVLVVLVTLAGTFYFVNKNKQANKGKEKVIVMNPVQNYKNNDAYVEQVVNSFFQVAANLVNSKTLDLSYLEEVVDKNSNAFSAVEKELSTLRKAGGEIQFVINSLNITQKSDTLYEVAVTVDKINTNATENKPDLEDLLLTVKVQEGYKIVEYVKK